MNPSSILADSPPLPMVGLPAQHLFGMLWPVLPSFRRHDHGEGSSDHLVGAVTVNRLRAAVPGEYVSRGAECEMASSQLSTMAAKSRLDSSAFFRSVMSLPKTDMPDDRAVNHNRVEG